MKTVKDYFGSLVFDDRVMKATLSAKVYASLKKTIDEGSELDIGVANAVATANVPVQVPVTVSYSVLLVQAILIWWLMKSSTTVK